MYSECLPFTAIPHSARLFTDFLYHFDRLGNFFPEPPRSPDWILKQSAVETALPPSSEPPQTSSVQRWSAVAEILIRQNRSFGAGEQAIKNAQRLGQGSRAVVTGQQVGLFGGPAYAIFKALTAIKYAQEFTRAGIDCVPVFWMATEDHDFAEINHVLLPGTNGIQKVGLSSRGPEGAPAGAIPLGRDVNDVLRAAADAFGESEFMRGLREAYNPDATFGSAFARFMALTFAPYGLVLMDPAHPELHSLSAPIYSAVIDRSAGLNRAVLDRNKELETAGYHQQVKVTSGTSFLFALENGIRTPVQRSTSGFHISGEAVSSQSLLEVARNQPERLSPNALLRACIQDYLLPTTLYIGGPAEVAYWAQSAPLQQQLLGRATPIAHRFSATLIEPPQARLLKKYGMAVTDLFTGPEHTRERLAVRVLPAQLQTHFSQSREAISQQLAVLQTDLEKLDRTLVDAAKRVGSKMLYQLERLRSRAARAELRRNGEVSRHADRLSLALYPEKDLQERVYPGALYLARYGPDLLGSLLEQIHIECPDHQLVYL